MMPVRSGRSFTVLRPRASQVQSTTTAGGNPWLDVIFSIPPKAYKAVRFQCVVSVPGGYFGYPRYRAKLQLDDGEGTEPSHGELANFYLEAGLDAPTNSTATLLGLVGKMDADIPSDTTLVGVIVSGIQTDANAPFAPVYEAQSGVLEVLIE